MYTGIFFDKVWHDINNIALSLSGIVKYCFFAIIPQDGSDTKNIESTSFC